MSSIQFSSASITTEEVETGNIPKTLKYQFSKENKTISNLISFMLKDTTVFFQSHGTVCIALKANLFMVDVYREER
jgi:hypothetical protein